MTEPPSPIVSIVTPLHNSREFIVDTVESVIAQTMQNWEMLMVDDCSTDDSVAIAQGYADKDARIKVIRLTENGGAAEARNAGIRAATGRYIAFLDSDDMWLPEKLERQIAFMQTHNCPFSYSAYEKLNEAGESIGYAEALERVDYKKMLQANYIGCLTAVYDTRYFGKTEMPLIRKRQDYGLWLKLLKQTQYACGIQQPLARYRVRAGSISANKFSTSLYIWRLYYDVEKFPFWLSLYYFTQYTVRAWVVKRLLPMLSRQ